MNYSSHIPAEILVNPNAEKFVTVMDLLDAYKQEQIHKALRYYRGPLCTNRPYLIKRLNDLGFPDVPADMPKDVLDALQLNCEDINSLRGCKQGLELWLWCLTFGDVVVDSSAFYTYPTFIQLSDPDSGYYSWFEPNITATPSNPELFYFEEMVDFGVSTLDITITSKYYNNDTIKNYIIDNIKKYIPYINEQAVINFTWINGPYVTNTFPHQYFVLP